MFQAYWGLHHNPFRNSVDANRLFRTAACDEALARLHFLVEGHWRLGVVLGPSGIGKSLLNAVLAAELRRQSTQVVQLSVRGLEPAEMVWQLATNLGLCPREDQSTARIWRTIADRFAENAYQQIDTVLLFDDIDRATPAMQENLLRLVKSDSAQSTRLSIVSTVNSEACSQLTRVLPLVDLRVELAPWSFEDTEEYVKTALERAGCKRPIFAKPAIERIHAISRGIPRRINQLAELAILAGAVGELRQVNAQTVETVELELGAPALV